MNLLHGVTEIKTNVQPRATGHWAQFDTPQDEPLHVSRLRVDSIDSLLRYTRKEIAAEIAVTAPHWGTPGAECAVIVTFLDGQRFCIDFASSLLAIRLLRRKGLRGVCTRFDIPVEGMIGWRKFHGNCYTGTWANWPEARK